MLFSSQQDNNAKIRLAKARLQSRLHSTFPTHTKRSACKQKSGIVAKLKAFKESQQITDHLN